MTTRNHYAVLGVPRSESTAGIRAAFGDLVKRHHPDRAGTEDADRFRELVGAYRVLADPESRRAYDEDLRRQRAHDAVSLPRLQSEWDRRGASDGSASNPAGCAFGEPLHGVPLRHRDP